MPLNATVVKLASIARQTTGTSYLTTPVRSGERGIGGERTSAAKRAVLTIARQVDAAAGTAVEGTIAVWGADLPHPYMGAPLGNAFAAAATSVMNQIVGDGTTTAFQTDIPFAAFSNNNWIVETPGFKLSGTMAVSTAGAVTGSSTAFDTQTKVGDVIVISGQTFTVATVTSATAITVTPAPSAAIGAGATGINISKDRRYKTWITSGSIGSTNPELFTVTDPGSGLALITFAVAPPKMAGPSTATTLATGAPIDVGAVYKVTPVEVKTAGSYQFDRSGIRSRTVMWVLGTQASNNLSATDVSVEHGTD